MHCYVRLNTILLAHIVYLWAFSLSSSFSSPYWCKERVPLFVAFVFVIVFDPTLLLSVLGPKWFPGFDFVWMWQSTFAFKSLTGKALVSLRSWLTLLPSHTCFQLPHFMSLLCWNILKWQMLTILHSPKSQGSCIKGREPCGNQGEEKVKEFSSSLGVLNSPPLSSPSPSVSLKQSIRQCVINGCSGIEIYRYNSNVQKGSCISPKLDSTY